MVKKLYFATGVLFEAFVMRGYIKEKVPYALAEIITGGIIDIVAWPVVLLVNIIEWSR